MPSECRQDCSRAGYVLVDSPVYRCACMCDFIQSTLRPPEVHMFYRKIELCIVRMGDNDMRTACTLEQEMVDHVILELHIKEASRYN